MGLPRLNLSVQKSSLIVQMIQSFGSMILAFVLAKKLGDSEYGIYVLLLSVQLFVLGFVDSLINVPLVVRLGGLRSVNESRLRKIMPEILFVILTVSVVVGLLFNWAYLFFDENVLGVNAVSGLVFASFSLGVREYIRSYYLLLKHPKMMLVNEIVSAVILIISLFFLVYFDFIFTGRDAIWVLSSPLLFQVFWVKYHFFRKIKLINFRFFRCLLFYGADSLVAAKFSWVQSQSYVFFISSMISTAALGRLAVVRMIYSPLQSALTGGIKGILPMLVKAFKNDDISRFRKILVLVSLVYFSCVLIVFVFSFLFLGEILSVYMPGYSFELIDLTLWTLVFWVMGQRVIFVFGIRATGNFTKVLKQSVIGAVTSCALIPLLILNFGMSGALIGMLVAEFIVCFIASLGLRQFFIKSNC